MTFRGRRILETLIVTLCAGDPMVLEKIRMQHVVLRAEKHIAELPPQFFLGFKVVLYLIEFLSFPLVWKFRRFTRMKLEDRIWYLETWENSPVAIIRNLFKLVKAICVCHIFSEHRLLAEIGYGEAIEERMRKRPSGSPGIAEGVWR